MQESTSCETTVGRSDPHLTSDLCCGPLFEKEFFSKKGFNRMLPEEIPTETVICKVGGTDYTILAAVTGLNDEGEVTSVAIELIEPKDQKAIESIGFKSGNAVFTVDTSVCLGRELCSGQSVDPIETVGLTGISHIDVCFSEENDCEPSSVSLILIICRLLF